MGLFWNLYQQSQISTQEQRTATMEQRVQRLEQELHRTQWQLHQLVGLLERHFGQDIDGDGRIG